MARLRSPASPRRCSIIPPTASRGSPTSWRCSTWRWSRARSCSPAPSPVWCRRGRAINSISITARSARSPANSCEAAAMDAMTNNFKAAIKSGKKQNGLWLSLMNSYTAELCAGAGFDWFLIDAEHAPNTLENILHQLQAIAPYGVAPVVRPANRDPDMLKLLLDMGVRNFLIPMVESAEQARALVGAVRYPPRGYRGVGHVLGRASRWGRVGDYLKRSDDEICLLVQIESRQGMDNLEAIAAVDGVDGLFVGPADLSA